VSTWPGAHIPGDAINVNPELLEPSMPNRFLARLAAALIFSAASASAATAQTTEEPALDTVVATVNGEVVTLGEVIIVRAGLPAQYQQVPDDQLYEAIVEQLVNRTLLAQQAKSKGYQDSLLAKTRSIFDHRDFLANLELRDVVEAATTEEEIRKEYDKRHTGGEPVIEVRASHILVAEKELADEIHAKLVEGADFAELAKEFGTDGTKDRGGDLGYFTRGDMVPAFSDAAFGLEIGAFSEPVQSQFGWHLILLADKRERPVPEFETVRDEIGKELAGEAVKRSMEALRVGASVVQPEPALDPGLIRRDDLLTAK
jgi:peptidyl-prolyl cis-trans isomerase C